MYAGSISKNVYKLTKANEKSKEFRREKYEKIKELFKLVRECEKGDKAFNLNVEEVYETYHKVEEAYEEIKRLERGHTDLHEKMRELFNKKSNDYEEEILFVFNNSAEEMRCSYNRALNEIDDNFSKYCTLRPSEIGDLWGEDRIYDIFHKALKEERERTEEVVARTNEEVKRILDLLYHFGRVNIKGALFVFNNSASEMERSYNRVLKKIDDKFKEDYEGGEETTKRERGEIFDILRKVITERLKKIQEVMARTNKEVKRILAEFDKLDEENIGMGAMMDLHGRFLEETKEELSFQFMSLKMLRYIKRHIEKIEAP